MVVPGTCTFGRLVFGMRRWGRNFMVGRVLDKLWRPWRGLTSS